MKKAVLLALLLGSCQTTQDQVAADDARCRSYGAKPGDQAYISCRLNLDTNRANVTASERFGNSGGLVGAIERLSDR